MPQLERFKKICNNLINKKIKKIKSMIVVFKLPQKKIILINLKLKLLIESFVD